MRTAREAPDAGAASLFGPGDGRTRPEVLVSTGIGRLHLIDTASAIRANGWSVSLITGWAPGPGERRIVNAAGRLLGQKRLFERLYDRRRLVDSDGCAVRQCPLSEAAMTLAARVGLGGRAGVATAIWALFGWESRRFLEGARVFHVRSGAGGGGAIERARQRGMKVVADHSIAHPAAIWRNLRENGAGGPDAEGFAPSSRFWRAVMRDCAVADAVLVNSDYVRQTLLEQGFEPEKVHVAYLGVGNDLLAVKTTHRLLQGEPIRALFVGHFVKRKGSHVMIESARLLRQQGTAVEFHVAGQAHDGVAEAEAGGVGDRFRFHGLLGRDGLRRLLASCDLFVFPTLAEGCAKSAMEALGAGLPVVTTRECGLPDAAGDCVETIPLGDARTLAAAIGKLGADVERRRRLGAAGAELVRKSFGTRNFQEAMGEFYDRLLESGRAAATGRDGRLENSV